MAHIPDKCNWLKEILHDWFECYSPPIPDVNECQHPFGGSASSTINASVSPVTLFFTEELSSCLFHALALLPLEGLKYLKLEFVLE